MGKDSGAVPANILLVDGYLLIRMGGLVDPVILELNSGSLLFDLTLLGTRCFILFVVLSFLRPGLSLARVAYLVPVQTESDNLKTVFDCLFRIADPDWNSLRLYSVCEKNDSFNTLSQKVHVGTFVRLQDVLGIEPCPTSFRRVWLDELLSSIP